MVSGAIQRMETIINDKFKDTSCHFNIYELACIYVDMNIHGYLDEIDKTNKKLSVLIKTATELYNNAKNYIAGQEVSESPSVWLYNQDYMRKSWENYVHMIKGRELPTIWLK